MAPQVSKFELTESEAADLQEILSGLDDEGQRQQAQRIFLVNTKRKRQGKQKALSKRVTTLASRRA